jgi:hypothetical protein
LKLLYNFIPTPLVPHLGEFFDAWGVDFTDKKGKGNENGTDRQKIGWVLVSGLSEDYMKGSLKVGGIHWLGPSTFLVVLCML